MIKEPLERIQDCGQQVIANTREQKLRLHKYRNKLPLVWNRFSQILQLLELFVFSMQNSQLNWYELKSVCLFAALIFPYVFISVHQK